jgi:hypothetical protein
MTALACQWGGIITPEEYFRRCSLIGSKCNGIWLWWNPRDKGRQTSETHPEEFHIKQDLLPKMQKIWSEHFIPRKVKVVPYKIHSYRPGGHFKPHRECSHHKESWWIDNYSIWTLKLSGFEPILLAGMQCHPDTSVYTLPIITTFHSICSNEHTACFTFKAHAHHWLIFGSF